MESFPSPKPEQGPSDKDLVLGSLEQLEGEAADAFDAVQSLTGTQEEFIEAIAVFNALSPEARNLGKYDHDRPLTENIDRTFAISSPKGYPLGVTLRKNGEVTLATSLS